MKIGTLGALATALGITGTVGAFIWWYAFYDEIGKIVGVRGRPPLECLYSSSGPCGLVAGVSSFAGVTPYNPMLLWVAVAATVFGVILMVVGRDSDDSGPVKISRTEDPPF